MPESVRVSISTSTILKFFVVVLGLLLAYVLRDVLAILVVAIVFAAALDPLVDSLQRNRLPRAVGILLVYLVVVGVLAVIGALFVPLVRDQISQLKDTLPGLTQNVFDFFQRVQGTVPGSAGSGLDQSLNRLTANVFSGLAGVFGGIVTTFGVLVLTFYLTVEEQGFRKFLTAITPKSEHERAQRILSAIQIRLGVWLRGQLLLTLLIGAASYVGLLILGVKFTLVLALIAGVTEFIPIAGPLLGAVPAVVVAFNQSPLKALLVILLYILIQQLENHIVVPKVMSRVTGLNPAVVIVVMLVGAKLAGIAGILLAIPLTIIGQVLVSELWENRPAERVP
jgi:predicted PurR-regulated permease PerM